MITCRVELYGISAETAGMREVQVVLEDSDGLPEFVAALVRVVPALDGTICQSGTDRLADDQILTVNGRFYHNGDRLALEDGDVVRVLTRATGG